jgi:hypothetical protein
MGVDNGQGAAQSDAAELTFGNEAERIAAMEMLPEDSSQESLAQLERIRGAKIVEGAGGQESASAEAGTSGPQAAGAPVPASGPAVPASVSSAPPSSVSSVPPAEFSLSAKALRDAGFTYNNPDDVIKGLAEKEKYIQELQGKIREHLQVGDNAAAKRIADLEAEVARMRGGASQAPAAPVSGQQPQNVSQQIAGGGIAEVNAILANIKSELDGLDDEDNDPYGEDTSRRQRELIKLQAQALERIAGITVQTAGAAEAREAQRRAEAARASEIERNNARRAATFAELDAVGKDPELSEYKLPKPAVELEAEYIRWRQDVAAAYYGGPARGDSAEETAKMEAAALHQLEAKNPDLINRCRQAGIPAEPTQGVNAYLALVDNLSYMDGWRPDPANPGMFIRLTRYDSATRQEVPVLMPNLVTAIKQKRLEEGVYKQQIDRAYQHGAQSLAAALTKRDPTIGELNNPATMGSSGNASQEWAARFLEDVDPDEVRRKLAAGDRTMLDDMNKARAMFNMAPVSFGE